MKKLLALCTSLCLGLLGCDPTIPPMEDAVTYRALATHPGCSTAGLTAYSPAEIPGYTCAAKGYAFPAGVTEDTSKPIVLLIHGNSSTPADFETFAGDASATPMLAERLVAAGFRTYAVDLRIDRVDDPVSNNTTENAARNVDHGWSVPIAAHFIESVMKAYPERKISIAGFSLGTTIARDALRRLYADNKKPFHRIQDLVLAAGGNHGVSTYRALCSSNPTMRGRVACEMGDRTTYSPTPFLALLNGEAGAFETPCADGNTAYGTAGVCGGNKVQYTTIVMRDISQGTYQDEFVSEASSALLGADNQLLSLTDNDLTNYFWNGLFKNHFGSIRSEAALQIAMNRLSQ